MLVGIYLVIAVFVLFVAFSVDVITAFAGTALFVFLLLYSKTLKRGRRF